MLGDEKLDSLIGSLDETVREDTEKLIQAFTDRRVNQALQTRQKKEVPSQQVQEPQQVQQPTQQTTGKVTVDDLVKREAMLDLREKAIITAIEKGVPPAIALKMVEKDEETTNTNLDSLFEFAEAEKRRGFEKALAGNTSKQYSGDSEPMMSEELIAKHFMDTEWLHKNAAQIQAYRRGNKNGWFK